MKKLLLLTALLLSCLVQGQDKDFAASLSNLDYTSAKGFADDIAASAVQTKWVYLHDKGNAKNISFYYIDSSLDARTAEDIRTGKQVCETGECLQVAFTINNDIYKFKNVKSKYADLFPIWKKYFNPEAEPDKTPNDYKLKECRKGKDLYKFREEESPYWTIEKFY